MKVFKNPLVTTLSVLGLVGSVLLPASASAVAQSQGNREHAAGIIHYSTPDPKALHIVLKGVKASNGCKFSLSGKVSASKAAKHVITEYNETSYDPATCQSFIDEIQVPAAAAPTASPGRSAAASDAGGGQSNGLDGVAGVSANVPKCANPYRDTHHSYSHDNCIDSWFQDVVGKHVTEVRNEIQWNPAHGCADYGRAYSSWDATWLANDGWFEDFSHFVPTFTCSKVVSALEDSSLGNPPYGIEFENDIFCAGSETTNWYASHISGYGNGSYYWHVDWAKYGACQSLLSWHDQAS